MTQSSGPLEGIKVIDLTSFVMGPLATQHLADMGADVIKVESRGGDLTRFIGPRCSADMASTFLGCNRNKRSIVLDLKQPGARDVLHRLVAGSDIVIHNVRKEAASRIGLTPESLRRANAGLVYCHATGFADAGAYAGQPALDDTMQAASGLAMLQTVVAGEPRYIPTYVADKVCAIHLAYAVMLALFHRQRSGRGQDVELPMFEVTAAFTMVEHLWGACFEPPRGAMGYESVRKGVRKPYPTLDGHLALAPHSDAHWHRIFELAGRQDLIDDSRYGTFTGRMQNSVQAYELLEQAVRTRTTGEWIELLGKEGVPMAAANSIEALIDEPHLASVDFWQMVEHHSEGMLRMIKNPIGLSETPPALRRLPPRLGQHTREVLGEFNFDSNAIEGLLQAGIVSEGSPAPSHASAFTS